MVAPVAITNGVVAGGVPSSGQLIAGALAVNVTDCTLYTKRYDGTVVRVEGDGGNDTLASAATLALGAVMSAFVDVTGTTAITAITLRAGQTRTVRFTGILTLTNGASLILPGGANITTAAGDYATFRGYASNVVRCVGYTKSAGFVSATTTITDDTTTNATMYPAWVTAASGGLPLKVSSTKLSFNPSSGLLTATAVNAAVNGTLGIVTPAAAVVTTLTANGAVALSPANANVVMSPTGTGVVTINPATAGAMDNVVIGANTAKAATVTTLNKVTITAPSSSATLTIANGKTATFSNTVTLTCTDGSTLAIGAGGTLGTAAYTASTAYEPTSSIGTWTPTDASGASLTFSTATGRYFNIGKYWFVSGRVVFPSTANAAQAAFGGLPATCGSSGHPEYNATGSIIGGGTANKIGPDRGSTVGYLYTTGNTGATNAGQSLQTLDFSFGYLAA